MTSPRIPNEIVKQWGKVKRDLIPTIEKAKGPTLTPEFKKDMKKKVEALFTTFDSGLRDKLKKVSDAKSDADAKKALEEIVRVSTDYLNKLKAAKSQWGVTGTSIARSIETPLTQIKDAASAALRKIA
jgi:hypothetical protein